MPELRLTAQQALPRRPAAAAAAVAGEAGAMVAALQAADLAPALTSPPERLLEAAARKAAVLEAVLPDLAGRLDAVVGRLREAMPAGLALVPAHGDFHVDQLLVAGDGPSFVAADGDPRFVAAVGPSGIAVVDFDQMCVAPAALDLATYAADVVRGRPSDLERVHAVLEPLLEGYGGRPEALDWHLAAAVLGRAAHPFQRQVPRWRERAEATVAVAEACLG